MIENRPLNKIEINLLLAEAPESEVSNLIRYLRCINQDAYDFLNQDAVYRFGLIADQRPIYFAYIICKNNKYELWTVVNKDVKEQFSLYKHSKRSLEQALVQFSPIYATMETHNHKNIEWVKRMGFKEIINNGNTITFKIEHKE